ncbi:unnamed protein product [Rotaria sordida]|uniref:Uncharacterized protein n=2 Tax=Rotaria sordida TaxID=392033 RepID=A0A814IJ19_9BILA|nr:unnamed protein product [Rotaria sordida]
MKSTPSEILDYRCRLESPTSLGRSGVSQIYQLHGLQAEGYKILQELFTNIKDKLFNEYGVRTYSTKNEIKVAIDGVVLNQYLTKDIDWLGIDRFTLEIILRKEFCLKFNNQIEWKCNSRVMKLIVDQSSNIVKDFIIDCTGHNTSSSKWLKESLNLIVPTVQIHFGGGAVTFIGERFRTGNPTFDSAAVIGAIANPPKKNTSFILSPVRQINTTDQNSLGILTACAIAFPIIPNRHAIDERKYVEVLGKKWPQNYVLLGDAMCTFNPQYAQGMTHACRQARELGKIFGENCHKLKDISHIFNRRASKITEECWLASTVND